MTPKVSVCIPAYNRRAMLRATLWSVLRQTHRNLEVIISDNASEDDLAAEVAAAADTRVRYIRQPVNAGPLPNSLFLEGQGDGEYVLFLCSDDLLLPDCLATVVAALEQNPGRGSAYYMAAHYDEDGFKFTSRMPDRSFAAGPEFDADADVRDFRFPSPSLCVHRREAFRRAGGLDRNRELGLIAAGDWDVYARMVRRGGGALFVHEVLAIIRLHPNRHSNTSALHWEFYSDVMKLAALPEYSWGHAYRAMAIVEQLLWDWRLKRSPRRTLGHAWATHAFPGVLPYLPLEIFKRARVKITRALAGAAPDASPRPGDAGGVANLGALDGFWRAAEAVRTGVHS